MGPLSTTSMEELMWGHGVWGGRTQVTLVIATAAGTVTGTDARQFRS